MPELLELSPSRTNAPIVARLAHMGYRPQKFERIGLLVHAFARIGLSGPIADKRGPHRRIFRRRSLFAPISRAFRLGSFDPCLDAGVSDEKLFTRPDGGQLIPLCHRVVVGL